MRNHSLHTVFATFQAALQKASVQQVIEAALAGQVDPDAVPSDTSAGSKNSGSPGLSGRCELRSKEND